MTQFKATIHKLQNSSLTKSEERTIQFNLNITHFFTSYSFNSGKNSFFGHGVYISEHKPVKYAGFRNTSVERHFERRTRIETHKRTHTWKHQQTHLQPINKFADVNIVVFSGGGGEERVTSVQKMKQPWMTKALFKSCKTKPRLYKTYLMSHTPSNKKTRSWFFIYRNKFKLIRVECEKQYFADQFMQCENNNNKTWKIVKHMF